MFDILSIPTFRRELKRLAKKYRSILDDVRELITELEQNPLQGESIGKDCYKIRLLITSKNRGKSGGGRVIICVKIVDEKVHLLTIYDKSEKENLESGELDQLLTQM
jgi:mRNA-degrading endonuclease RelE of RelBE toxin-antitoxin system